MKSLAYLALIATAGLSVAAHAEDAGQKADKNSPDKLICRSEPVIGSRLAKNKRCMTKAQWDEDRRLSRLQLEQNQNNRYKND
ncbi:MULTISPECIES: hypothetical protein [unclassified Sphingomonas]|uniref:hypothetical protein n=1 Tax=unclassified Sphingomonas TaxID=196159 RepID=UPI0006F7FCC0|nr:MULTISPECIES: hypothetical protein [unclassified Sphingomonas]KQX21631.1 hypothetical protein ASD17_06675 [Sphingomonas sp. Root1294]KQY72948.1 hypothetical protein ASD39_00660 [Sphingomonas sp. Root50]KRB88259.1 hypothetical protein ASE22_22775 [Sphingomonas sp. Root720]